MNNINIKLLSGFVALLLLIGLVIYSGVEINLFNSPAEHSVEGDWYLEDPKGTITLTMEQKETECVNCWGVYKWEIDFYNDRHFEEVGLVIQENYNVYNFYRTTDSTDIGEERLPKTGILTRKGLNEVKLEIPAGVDLMVRDNRWIKW